MKNSVEERLKKTVIDLSEKIGPRPPGSFAELEAAKYLRQRFEEIGLNVKIEKFKSPSHLAISSSLKIGNKKFPSLPAQFSASGEVEGKLIFLGNCDLEIKKEDNFSGKIGLLNSLTISKNVSTRTKLLLTLEEKGMEGLIVVSPYLDNILTKVVRYPEIKKMPIVIVSYRTACQLKRNEGKEVKLIVERENRERNESQNVVAKIEGPGKNWLVISSHYDTAPFCPGATDDAGGVAVVLELARILKDSKLPATVYFLLTGSEEYGGTDMTGRGPHDFFSRRENDLENCIGYVDTDDMGTLLGTPQIFIGGPKKFKEVILDTEIKQKYQFKGKGVVGDDHGVAEQYGIPFVWVTDTQSSSQPYFHSPEDTIEFLDFAKLKDYIGDIKRIVEKLSRIEPVNPFIYNKDRLIRPARWKDIPDILEITKLAFEPVSMDRMREDFFGEKLGGKNWYEYKQKEVESFCKNHIYETIVTEMDGKVVGYATYILDEERGIAEIGNNAVHPDYQGRGIGKDMQKEIERRMKEEGYRKFAVTTLSNDLVAQRIYEKLGYKRYAESYHYLKKDD